MFKIYGHHTLLICIWFPLDTPVLTLVLVKRLCVCLTVRLPSSSSVIPFVRAREGRREGLLRFVLPPRAVAAWFPAGCSQELLLKTLLRSDTTTKNLLLSVVLSCPEAMKRKEKPWGGDCSYPQQMVIATGHVVGAVDNASVHRQTAWVKSSWQLTNRCSDCKTPFIREPD